MMLCVIAVYMQLYCVHYIHSLSLPLPSLFSQDETLVHCSLSPLENPEFTFDVEFEGEVYDVSAPTYSTCVGGKVSYSYGIIFAGQCSIKTVL